MDGSAVSGGYVSEQSKRTFTIWAGILGVVFFLVQMFAPMIAMFAIMPGFVFGSEFVTFDCDGGQALVAGRLYLIEKRTSAGFERQAVRARLVRLEGERVEGVADLGESEPYLLGTESGLLLISQRSVGHLEGTQLVGVEPSAPLGEISVPFLLEGSPALVEYRPDRRRLLRWDGAEWREVRTYPSASGPARTRFLTSEGRLLEFRRKDETLYFRDLDGDTDWEVVSPRTSNWSALLADGRPAVVVAAGDRLHLHVREEGGWRELRSAPSPGSYLSLLEAFEPSAGGPLALLTSRFTNSLRVSDWSEGGLEERFRIGSSSPFPASMMAMVWLAQAAPALLSLVLAIVLSALMRTHRVGEFRAGDRTVAHASLTRRAVAQLLDSAIGLAPMAAAGYAMFLRFEDLAEGPKIVLWMFGAMAALLVWMMLVLVAFSVGEGRWGVTPGKWATGIRVVGTDLAPCGFGRALVRNLLKLVDGFFNFLIGILMVAYTPEWQRLGDLAARTIVVRTPPGGLKAIPGPTPG